jgi:tetratricopeptide (TPR) repeat protein
MRPLAGTLVLVLVSSFGLVAAPARAQDEAPTVSEEDATAARDLVELARPQMARGSYADALRSLRQARQADPTNADAVLLFAIAQRETGKPSAALRALTKLDTDVRVLNLRAELLMDTGAPDADVEAVLEAAQAVAPDDLRSQRLRGRLLEEAGRREEAVDAYLKVNSIWARSEGEDGDDDLLAVARARLGVFRLTDEYRANVQGVLSRLEPIVRRSPDRVDAMVEIAELYLGMHQDQDAKRWFEKALARNPHHAPAIFGTAQQKAFRFEETEARKEAERALRENPAYVPAMLFLAAMDLGDGRYDEARASIDKALDVNARHAETLATRAALRYLEGDQDGFDREVRGILDRDRFASESYLVLARILEEQRRFQEALVMGERAIEVDPRDWEAHFLVGRNAMNVGDDEKAEKHLQAAEDGDLFRNIYRFNFLKLFKKMQRFPVRDDELFVVKLPLEEDEAYFPLLRHELGRSLADLEERWGFRPDKPLFISVFDQQSDFAARTIGLPGFPALGACFGRVVTLDSPRALPPGAFSWRGTLHHELAHVITLELSKGRVPRWLTEGLSVYEERKVSPQWNREMERVLIDAIASDEVLTLENINSAFRGPRVMFAYYQGGLMCEMIERDFGFPALREMVRLYGDGLRTPEVVRRALSIEPEEFDSRFLAYAKDYVAPLQVLPRPSPGKMRKLSRRLRREKLDADGWLLLASGHVARGRASDALSALSKAAEARPVDPRLALMRALVAQQQGRPDKAEEFARQAVEGGADLYEARRLLASAAARAERFGEAKEHLVRAIELFPVATGPGSPRLELAKLLQGEGEDQLLEAMRLLREHADVAEDDWQTRVVLWRFYEEAGETDAELATLLELRDIVPLPHGDFGRRDALRLHERVAVLSAAAGDAAAAELAWRLVVGVARMETRNPQEPPLEGPDLADLLVRHAEALRLVGRLDEAQYRLEEALRLDPEHPDALELRDRLRPE